MKISRKRKLLIEQLDNNLALLDKSLEVLNHSFVRCSAIGEKEDYDLKEQESFEALTSRFARASDICTQKALKSFFAVLQENARTIIDSANLLEKLEIIEVADDILNIRELPWLRRLWPGCWLCLNPTILTGLMSN